MLSIIVPAYNEAATILGSLEAILLESDALDMPVELLLVDDGSRDTTAALVSSLAKADGRVRLLGFTRNFGKEAAIAAGLDHARGDVVIVMDADLQHPPELIPCMIERWRQGFAVVEAIKRTRGDTSLASNVSARLFYWLFKRFAGLDLAIQSDYKLLDRSVVERLRAMPERRRFFRGLVAWLGYPAATLPFDVPPRPGGETSWGRLRLMRYAIDNITGFSILPLALIAWIGALMLMVGLVTGGVALYQKFSGTALDGFTTVIILVILASGALMVSLGIVGIYLARIYEEIKGRPAYILRGEAGVSGGGEAV